MDPPDEWWPFVVIAVLDVLVVCAYGLQFMGLNDLVEVPFLLAYALCLVFPIPRDIDGLVFKLSSEKWWVGCVTLILVVAWIVVKTFQYLPFEFPRRRMESALLFYLTVVSVMIPCMGLQNEQDQLIYMVIVLHVLSVLMRLTHQL